MDNGTEWTKTKILIYGRLEPRTEWAGGLIADTDIVSIDRAAELASEHAKTEITANHFLEAAGRGQIPLMAITQRRAKVRNAMGTVCVNAGHPTDENTLPEGAIVNLPPAACKSLQKTGKAKWRALERLDSWHGEACLTTWAMLADDEPDFETVLSECMVNGVAVHALADAFYEPPPESAPKPIEKTEQQNGDLWWTEARRLATEYIAECEAIDTYPNQIVIADRVASELRKQGIFGASGKPLKGEYIKRHALTGISSAKPLNPKKW